MYDYNIGLRFQHTADQHSRRNAIWFNSNESISYEELNKFANRIARFLINRGVGARDVVCLSGEKSALTFATLIACLKLGAPYCVLDPDSPVERLRKMLAICRPRLLLAEGEFPAEWADAARHLEIELCIEDAWDLSNYDDTNLSQTEQITGSNPAYIMFTSGSTGFPKGAVITHSAVLNFIEWSRSTFRISSDDVVTNLNPLFFDNSVFDFYATLLNGACLTPFSALEVREPKQLVEKIAAAGCTLWFSVPSLLIFLQTMRATNGHNLKSIRRFIFGGEGYPKAKLKSLYETYSPAAEFFNVYGPTECTCICSSYKISDDDFTELQTLPALGQIAENFSSLILDETGAAVARGEIGELCLLGPNVGLGYYNDAEQTAASFVQNPLNDKFPEIMYRTGDLVSLGSDGKLYISGRRDNQIKHMGHRIELEEIESALNNLDYISEGAALYGSFNGLGRIVAVVAADSQFTDDQIRRDLKQLLPGYMVPASFYRETMLPRNANGKLDRNLLAKTYLQS